MLSLALTDRASKWCGLVEGTDDHQLDHVAFLDLVRREFTPSDYEVQAEDRLDALRMKGSLVDYLDAFRTLQYECTSMEDRELLRCFRRGLKPEYEFEVRRKLCKKLASAIVVATNYDDAHRATSISSRNRFSSHSGQPTPKPLPQPPRAPRLPRVWRVGPDRVGNLPRPSTIRWRLAT